jgi:hypothetical protein
MIPHDKMQRTAGCVSNTEHSHSDYWVSWIFWPVDVSYYDWNRELRVRAFTITSVSESFATFTWIDPLESRQPVFSVEFIAEFCMRDYAGYWSGSENFFINF